MVSFYLRWRGEGVLISVDPPYLLRAHGPPSLLFEIENLDPTSMNGHGYPSGRKSGGLLASYTPMYLLNRYRVLLSWQCFNPRRNPSDWIVDNN